MGKDVMRGERWFLGNSSFYTHGPANVLLRYLGPASHPGSLCSRHTHTYCHYKECLTLGSFSCLPCILWTRRWVERRFRGTNRRKGTTWAVSCLNWYPTGPSQSGGESGSTGVRGRKIFPECPKKRLLTKELPFSVGNGLRWTTKQGKNQQEVKSRSCPVPSRGSCLLRMLTACVCLGEEWKGHRYLL